MMARFYIIAIAVLVLSAGGMAYGASKEYRALSQSLTQNGAKALANGDAQKANALLEQAIVANPINAQAYILYGRSHALSNEPSEAVRLYGIGLNIDPTLRQAVQWRGEAYLALGDVARAREDLDYLNELCGNCTERETLNKALIQADKTAQK